MLARLRWRDTLEAEGFATSASSPYFHEVATMLLDRATDQLPSALTSVPSAVGGRNERRGVALSSRRLNSTTVCGRSSTSYWVASSISLRKR